MMADADIVARMSLNAREFRAEFDRTVGDAASRAKTAGDQIGRGLGDGVAKGSREQQYALRSLGSQLSDVSTQLSTGTSAAQIFAQQSGQVAGALAGMGGALGKVGAFLSGPWGAALLAATSLAAVFVSKQKEAEDGTDALARKLGLQKEALTTVQGAIEAVDRATGKYNRTTEQSIALSVVNAQRQIGVVEGLRAEVVARAAAARAVAGGTNSNFGLNYAADTVKSYADGDLSRIDGELRGLQAKVRSGSQDLLKRALDQRVADNKDAASRINAQERDSTKALEAEYAKRGVYDVGYYTRRKAIQDRADAARDGLKEAAAAQREAGASARREQRAAETAAQREAKAAAQRETALQGELSLLKEKGELAFLSASGREKELAIAQAELRLKRDLKDEERAIYNLAFSRLEIAKQANDLFQRQGQDLSRQAERDVGAYADNNLRGFFSGPDPITGAVRSGKSDTRDQQETFRYLSDTFYQSFSGRNGDIWSGFKDLGTRTLSELASQFILKGRIDISGTSAGALSKALGGEKLNAGIDKLLNSKVGNSTAGGFASAAGQGYQTGAAVGSLFGKSTETRTGGKVGGAVGGAVGKATGLPGGELVGSVAGAIFGSLLGGLFASTPKGSAALTQSGGVFGASDPTGNNAAAKGSAGNAARAVAGALNGIVSQLGGAITSAAKVSIGVEGGKFRVDPTGAGRTSKKQPGVIAFDKDERAAVEYAIRDAIKDGAIAGLDELSKKLLAKGDLETQLAKAVRLKGAFDEILERTDPLGRRIRDLNNEFAALSQIAQEAGATAEETAKLSKLYDDRLKEVRESTKDLTTTLDGFLKSLNVGASSPLSLDSQLGSAKADFAKYEAEIRAGKKVDQSAFVSSAQSLLDVSRQTYGSTADYFQIFDRVQSLTNDAKGAYTTSSTGIEALNPFVQKTADATTESARTLAKIDAAMSSQNALLAQIAAAVGQGGGGGLSLARGGFVRAF